MSAPGGTTTTLENLFTSAKCGELIKNQDVIVIDSESTVEHGCEVLIKHGISSAPVYDKKTNQYVGMFDYRDIVDYVLVVFKRKQVGALTEESEESSIGIRDIVRKAMTGEPVRIHFAADLSKKNPFYSVAPDVPLLSAVQTLAGGNGVHRVNVMDSNGIVKGVLSQTDVVRYILTKQSAIESIATKSLKELGLCRAPVISINGEATVMEALSRMSEYGISSIAVVDVSNCLVGNISMADIKYIFKYARYTRLWSTCAQFISVVLAQQGLENGGKDRFPVFDVGLESSIGFAMRKIIATKVHRVWVVDNAKKLVGIVSLTDIIRIFYQYSTGTAVGDAPSSSKK